MDWQPILDLGLTGMLFIEREREDNGSDGEMGERERREWILLEQLYLIVASGLAREGEECV